VSMMVGGEGADSEELRRSLLIFTLLADSTCRAGPLDQQPGRVL
jgi:hypothetical protein